jgi:hypothetical protein
MTRTDDYVLRLNRLKSNLRIQIMHCTKSLNDLQDIKAFCDYETSATTLEKSNIEELIVLIGGGLEVLSQIVWQ